MMMIVMIVMIVMMMMMMMVIVIKMMKMMLMMMMMMMVVKKVMMMMMMMMMTNRLYDKIGIFNALFITPRIISMYPIGCNVVFLVICTKAPKIFIQQRLISSIIALNKLLIYIYSLMAPRYLFS